MLGWCGFLTVALLTSTACSGVDNKNSLVVYSGRSESLVGAVIQQFEDASGIHVSVKYGSTSEIAATLQEEGKDSPADVFFAQDPGGLGAVAGMLSPLPEDIVDRVPNWARSPEGRWVGISGRARTIVYNTDRLTEADLPDTIEGFTDSAWKGRIGWAPSNGSFQTMVTAMRVMWGEERTRLWLEGIEANEPRVYPNNTSIVTAVEAAEVNAGFVNHYYLHRFIQEEGEDFSARNYYTKDGGPGSLVMVAGAGVLETSENRENAEKFVRFLLSTVAQQYFASQTFEYPLIDGVNISRLLAPLEKINSPAVDPADLDDLKGTQALLRDVGIIP
ncbi:MAG: iron ABC transporter substrate-binding protein [Chloroflexi bacterium]|nr:iron ABC transporter substrate-binding protein [Chloroflexota bacterium]